MVGVCSYSQTNICLRWKFYSNSGFGFNYSPYSIFIITQRRSFSSFSRKFLKKSSYLESSFVNTYCNVPFSSSQSSHTEILSLIAGTLLGSSYLEKEPCISCNNNISKPSKVRVVFVVFSNNVEYLKSIYLVLVKAGLCPLNCFKLHKLIGKGNKVFFLITFKTYYSTRFMGLYDIFYKCDSKLIPKQNYLYELLTPLTLATMFLSAIWLKEKAINTIQEKFKICFPVVELQNLIAISCVLKSKYNIDTVIHNLNPGLGCNIVVKPQVSNKGEATVINNNCTCFSTIFLAESPADGVSSFSPLRPRPELQDLVSNQKAKVNCTLAVSVKNSSSSTFINLVKPHILPSQHHFLNRSCLTLGVFQVKRGFTTLFSKRHSRVNLFDVRSVVDLYYLSNKYSLFTNRMLTTNTDFKDLNFIEWFRGFSDAEGSFIIKKGSNSSFSFMFQIALHKDDVNVLIFLQNYFNAGKISYYRDSVRWVVKDKDELKVIIDIFSKFSLNTVKHLNFLDFKQAFELYTNRDSWTVSSQLAEKITVLKNNMNSQRTLFKKDLSHKIIVSPYWLLGFVEGEGSFNVTGSDFDLRFSVTQSEVDLAVLEAIREFLLNLTDVKNFKPEDCKFIGIDLARAQKPDVQRNWYTLRTGSSWFIGSVLIPFFDSLV